MMPLALFSVLTLTDLRGSVSVDTLGGRVVSYVKLAERKKGVGR